MAETSRPDVEQAAKKKKKKGGYVVPANLMKLITLVTLLISDADVLFTVTSMYSYATNTKVNAETGEIEADPLIIMIILVGMFTFIYVGGSIIAARESYLFVDRFREKVRLNEIAGLDLEEMDLFFKGKPVRAAEQKTLESVEQEFHDKAEGKGARMNRAAREGHRTIGGMTTRGGGDEEAGEASIPAGGVPPGHVVLAPTPAEAKRKFEEDKERALYLLCQHKDITFAFFRERRSFARRVVKPSHSIPLLRLMVYGWQPTVSHTDFAGILNANALYSFTIGFPQLGCSIIYIVSYAADPILLLSLAVGSISLILSVLNMILDFPKQLFDIAQREGEAHVFALQAEEKSEFWTQKMEVEIQQQQEFLLTQSAAQSAQQTGARIEKPLTIIHEVMDLERECMRARVDYVAHQMFMALHESERRQAIRNGSIANPYSEEAEGQAFAGRPSGQAQRLPPPATVQLERSASQQLPPPTAFTPAALSGGEGAAADSPAAGSGVKRQTTFLGMNLNA